VTVHTFRGNREPVFVQGIQKSLDDEKYGTGPPPSRTECLLWSGHTGVTIQTEPSIVYGFNPNGERDPLWLVIATLKARCAYPGIVLDDSAIFHAATLQGLAVVTANIRLSDLAFQIFLGRLNAEKIRSEFTYGFPDGDGDCNCTTWLERMGLPLLTGSMEEFTTILGFATYPIRRFEQRH
jgi:hypothetical protein